LKKIQEIKEMSENISQSAEKSDIKEIMKKMIDDMSEAEMSKMLNASIEEKKFNLDLEENLRIKPEMSSTSSVVTKSIEMPQL
jgi:ribosomal protein S3AE